MGDAKDGARSETQGAVARAEKRFSSEVEGSLKTFRERLKLVSPPKEEPRSPQWCAAPDMASAQGRGFQLLPRRANVDSYFSAGEARQTHIFQLQRMDTRGEVLRDVEHEELSSGIIRLRGGSGLQEVVKHCEKDAEEAEGAASDRTEPLTALPTAPSERGWVITAL